jgi:hypothetical protein
LKSVFLYRSNLKVCSISSSGISFRASLKIFKSDFESLLRIVARKSGSTGLVSNFYRMTGSESICLSLAGSMFSAFLKRFIRFSSKFGSSEPRASANYCNSSSSSRMGVRFLRLIFLLLSIFDVIMSEFFDLFINRFYIAFMDKSFATLVKFSGFNVDSYPNMLFNKFVFSKFYPPIFFRAFKGESFPVALLSFNSIFNFSESIPLLSLSKFFVNYFVYFPFYSNNCLAISAETIPSCLSASFFIRIAASGSLSIYLSFLGSILEFFPNNSCNSSGLFSSLNNCFID